MKLKNMLLICGVVAFSGCVVTPEQVAEQRAKRDAATRAWIAERVDKVWGPKCETLGFPADSDKWSDCVMKLGNNEMDLQAEADRQNRARAEHWGRAMQNFGNTVYGPRTQQPSVTNCVQTPNEYGVIGSGSGMRCTTR